MTGKSRPPRRQHVVSQSALRPFAEPGGGLYRWDIRSGVVDPEGKRHQTRGVGWLPHFYSLGERGSWNTEIEELLSREYDERRPGFLIDVLDGALEDVHARQFAAEILMQQIFRTPRGFAQIVGAASTEEVAAVDTRDDVLQRFVTFLAIGRDHGFLAKNERWSLGRPPPGRLFVISDCPTTSRRTDWPELVPTQAGPQLSLPLTPEACLIVEEGHGHGYAGERELTRDEYDEIVFRTAMCADKWVWSHDHRTLVSLAKNATRLGYRPRFDQFGDWR